MNFLLGIMGLCPIPEADKQPKKRQVTKAESQKASVGKTDKG